jgi:DNA-binding NarL/FixJ family response regulator
VTSDSDGRFNADSDGYGLSERELDVLRLMAEGLSDDEIGSTLGITSTMASEHAQTIRAKMGTHSRTETAVRAIRQHLVCALVFLVVFRLFTRVA